MIFAKGEGLGTPLLVVGVTLDELRAMLDEPGRTVEGHTFAGDLNLVIFAAESDDECRRVLETYNQAGSN